MQNWHFLSTEFLFLSAEFFNFFFSAEFPFSERGILEGLVNVTLNFRDHVMISLLICKILAKNIVHTYAGISQVRAYI